jgi:hypothetical protein
MRFDPALAAQATFQEAKAELGSDWDTAVEPEYAFSSNTSAINSTHHRKTPCNP